MEFLTDYGLFLAKTVTLVVGVLVLVGSLVNIGSRMRRAERKGHIEIEKLNDHYREMKEALLSVLQTPEDYKKHVKEQKKLDKEQKKAAHNTLPKKRIFVLDFDGDIRASAAAGLEQIVSAIVSVAAPTDEVVIRLESAGGMVHGYGLAASQLVRFRHKNIPLTVCVDKVAASGGYMMACIGNRIISSPFAVIGSIGVLAQLPNFHRLLKKHDIDYELITAGEYKRTLTIFGENTEKGRAKFTEEIQDTHELFKDFIRDYRPLLNMEEVATGEVWFGSRALERHLVDKIQTSEEYLLDQVDSADIFHITYVEKKTLQERLGLAARHAVGSAVDSLMDRDRESSLLR